MKEGVLMTGNAMKLGAKKTGEIITHAKEKLIKQPSNTDTLIEVTEQTSVCQSPKLRTVLCSQHATSCPLII